MLYYAACLLRLGSCGPSAKAPPPPGPLQACKGLTISELQSRLAPHGFLSPQQGMDYGEPAQLCLANLCTSQYKVSKGVGKDAPLYIKLLPLPPTPEEIEPLSAMRTREVRGGGGAGLSARGGGRAGVQGHKVGCVTAGTLLCLIHEGHHDGPLPPRSPPHSPPHTRPRPPLPRRSL